jgi:outer membrane protein OmpA-like peptidoglycan-associated protein
MKNKYFLYGSLFVVCSFLAGCAGTSHNEDTGEYATPTVDYVEQLDVYSAPHKDSFLNQLAMNYRSYAIYNARTSGYPDIGELFAQKAVGAFSGENPFPESLDNWNIGSQSERFEIYNAYNELMDELKTDAIYYQPNLTAEAQAKFDCWISAAASGQNATAQECKKRFVATIQALRECMEGRGPAPVKVKSETIGTQTVAASSGRVKEQYYPETYGLAAMSGSSRARDGMIIVNNVNIPANLVQVVPVPASNPAPTQVAVPQQQPVIFNQNIYGVGDNSGNKSEDDTERVWEEVVVEEEIPVEEPAPREEVKEIPTLDTEYVSRDEFINIMMAMRDDLMAINKRLDSMDRVPVQNNEKTIIKVQQIPLEPKQHVMEEIFEIRFDFDKATIKPEYEDLIRKLASTTQANKNIKVTVVGHTDTAGSSNYNYALGGRRAEAVQKMLISYGIPSSQIIAVSAGEEDLKVQTPNNTPNAENRRVRVVKEVHYTEQPKAAPIVVEEYQEVDEPCEDCEEF